MHPFDILEFNSGGRFTLTRCIGTKGTGLDTLLEAGTDASNTYHLFTETLFILR